MPVKQFELSKEARKKRASFKVLIYSALLGTSAGLLTRLFPSLPFALETSSGQATLAAMIGLMLLIIVTVFYAMKTVLTPDDIRQIVEVYVAYNKDKGILVPIPSNRWGFATEIKVKLKETCEKTAELRDILKGKDTHAVQKLATDLVTFELLDKLATEYQLGWAPWLRYIGVSHSYSSFKSNKEGVQPPSVYYPDIPEELRRNNLFLRLMGESQMGFGKFQLSIPRKTTFNWAGDVTEGQQVLSFSNKYCKIAIVVSKGYWMEGLSPFSGRFVSMRNKTEHESLSYLQEHYAHTVPEIQFRARFNWFWSLMGSSNDYFNWVEDMFEKLDDFFSFEKEYHALEKANVKLVLD